MWTKKQVLVTSRPDGTIEIIPMRYNASHQRGWRCFIGALAEDPAAIGEDTVPSFYGRSLFDALAMYRGSIEPAGGRLLQAVASRGCWSDATSCDRFCRRFTLDSSRTELIDGFLPIDPGDSVALDEQQAFYEAWRGGLPVEDASAASGRSLVEKTNAAIRAAGEAAILARGDLASGEGA